MTSANQSKCTAPEFGALLLSYGIGTLTEEDRATFEEHLVRCQACQIELEKTATTLKALSGDRDLLVNRWKSVGEDFESRHDQQAGARDVTMSRPGRRRKYSHYWIAAVATCIVVIGLSLVGTRPDANTTDVTPTLPKPTVQPDTPDSVTTKAEPETQPGLVDIHNLATTVPLGYVFTTPRGSASAETPRGLEDAMKLYSEGHYNEADSFLTLIAGRSPRDLEVQIYLGITRYMAGNFETAIQALDTAESLNPRMTRRSQIQWYRANANIALNRPRAALDDLVFVAGDNIVYSEKARDLLAKIQDRMSPE
ncbi:MAG: hypothetical protein H6508_08265 [Calditrichaeota bacterium]|nr:hypothetical protein [Calditrichota bacterium]